MGFIMGQIEAMMAITTSDQNGEPKFAKVRQPRVGFGNPETQFQGLGDPVVYYRQGALSSLVLAPRWPVTQGVSDCDWICSSSAFPKHRRLPQAHTQLAKSSPLTGNPASLSVAVPKK